METLEEKVERFISSFYDQFASIRSACFANCDTLFKKLLYVGIIDALASTTSDPKNGNRGRFVSFIRTFSGWNYCNKISLPHLIKLLERVTDPEFSHLREFALSLCDKWEPGSILMLDKDPDYQEVKDRWPSHISKPFASIKLDFLQHVHLFYTYRNFLFHELRKPGYGMELKEDKEPYYHSMTHLDDGRSSWELVYPLGFYENICETALKELRNYYIKDQVDPYSCFIFGTYWIKELNIE